MINCRACGAGGDAVGLLPRKLDTAECFGCIIYMFCDAIATKTQD